MEEWKGGGGIEIIKRGETLSLYCLCSSSLLPLLHPKAYSPLSVTRSPIVAFQLFIFIQLRTCHRPVNYLCSAASAPHPRTDSSTHTLDTWQAHVCFYYFFSVRKYSSVQLYIDGHTSVIKNTSTFIIAWQG